MRYIIFGCGTDGQKALSVLGKNRVYRFVDNNKCGNVIDDILIISFKEMLEEIQNNELKIVIASMKYQDEMKKQLEDAGITEYMVFNPHTAPYYALGGNVKYPSCQEIITKFEIDRYNRIAIYGNCDFAKFIFNEISVSDMKCEAVPVYSLDEIETDKFDAVLICISRTEDSVRDSEWMQKNQSMDIMDIFDIYKFEPEFYHPELAKYKNLHKGKRIFVIGNGPSLRIEDLDRLHEHGEICIAANKIYRAYNKTQFRPAYLCLSDWRIINDCEEELRKLSGEVIAADNYNLGKNQHIEGVQYFHMINEAYYPSYPGFSGDMTQGFYWGFSVTYDIGIQLAAYMGAAEIYLLGVDNSFTRDVTEKSNHFIDNYHTEQERKNYSLDEFKADKINKAYEKAELYSRRHGFRIYNATRGGMLEAFERVDFDSLF